MKNMKRLLAILMAVAMLIGVSGIAEEDSPVEGTLVLDQTSVVMDYSQSTILTATASAGGDSISWSSSDESVAAVSAASGESVNVTGVNAGTATITCTSGDLTQTCEVTVNAPRTLQITGVDYPATFQMGNGGWRLRNGTLASTVDLATLTTVIKGANGEMVGRPFTYTFEAGMKRYDIRGIDNYIPFSRISAEGMYTWTLSATDVTGRSVFMSLPIHAVVGEATTIASNPGVYSPIIVASEIALDATDMVIERGETKSLVATVSPSEAANRTVMWISEDPSVAIVSPAGEVTGVGVGSTVISCRIMDNSDISASCTVTVPGEPEPVEAEGALDETQEQDVGAAGGRNLILNSDFSGMAEAGIYRFNGDEVAFSATDFGAEECYFGLQLSEYGIENLRGKMVLLSMEYRIDEALEFGTTSPWVGFQVSIYRDETTGGESQPLNWYGGTSIPTAVTEDWVRYSCVVQVSDYDATNISPATIYFRDTKGTIRFRHPKIEIIDTDWSLAPEDMR